MYESHSFAVDEVFAYPVYQYLDGWCVLCCSIVPVLMQIYPKVILPAALLVLLQGICYGLFTKWGFFQHPWIKVKWILAILTGLCTGLGMMGALETVLAKIPLQGFQGGFADGGATLFFLSLQVLFLCMMTGVSICKMRKKQAAR